jgi:hypothetical protein
MLAEDRLRQRNGSLQSRDEELGEPKARNLDEPVMPLVIDEEPLVRLTGGVPT